MIHVLVLGYADDAVILEDGTPRRGVQQITERVNSISQGSKKDVDMLLNADKTEVMYIRVQDEVPPATQEEAREICKFTCPHLNCGYMFETKVGMLIHAGGCEWKDEFKVDFITNHRGPVTTRQYNIRWKTYSTNFDTWEPRGNLHPEFIKDYELANDAYVHGWRFRCDQ